MERSLRIITGLVLYLFIATHLLNIALGVISVDLIEQGRPIFMYIWSSRPGGLFLLLCMIIHAVLGFRTLYFRNTLNMTASDTIQFASGFIIPPLLFPHVWGVIAVSDIFGVTPTYPLLMRVFWIDTPLEGLRQVIMLVVIWVHGSIGIFTWLRLKTWWPQIAPLMYPLVVLVPVLGMLGFVEGGNSAIAEYETSSNVYVEAYPNEYNLDETEVTPEEAAEARQLKSARFRADYKFTLAVKWYSIGAYLLMLIMVLAARYFRLVGKSGHLTLRYDDGTIVEACVGPTILELSHQNAVPHANLCKGRGRCGTCRVRVIDSTSQLSEPSELELTALDYTDSGPDIRLACQCVPGAGKLEIERMLQPDISYQDLRSKTKPAVVSAPKSTPEPASSKQLPTPQVSA